MRHWKDATILKRSRRPLKRLSRKVVPLRTKNRLKPRWMKAQLKKSLKLHLLGMKNKRTRRKKKRKRRSCHHFQILFHLKLRLLKMLQKKLIRKMQRQRPPWKKKMQNRVKSRSLLPPMLKLKRAKLRKQQLSRKHK